MPHIVEPPSSPSINIPFKQLILALSEELGSLFLPVDEKAQSAAGVVLNHTAYYALMREMVLRLYKENALRSINGPVSLYACLDAVGDLRGNRIRNQGDIDEIQLIDRVGELLVELFSNTPSPTHSRQNRRTGSSTQLRPMTRSENVFPIRSLSGVDRPN